MIENTVIRVTDPATLHDKIIEGHRLRAAGKKVVILVDDIDAVCKVHDADTIAEWLCGLRFEETEQYSWGQLALKSRQKWIEDEEKTDQGAGNQAD